MKGVFGLPTARLEHLVTIHGGGTPSRSNPEYYSGTIPWVTPKDMKRWEIHDTQEHITARAIDQSATKLIPAHSVLVVARSGVLKHTLPVALNRVAVTVNQDMKALVCGERVCADYLARYIKHASPVLLGAVRATTADNFPLDVLKALPVPLPSVAEQARIAAIIDKADLIRHNRCESRKLTTALIVSAFLDTFGDPFANPKNWPIHRLGEHISFITSGSRGWAKYYAAYGVRFIRSLDVQMNRIPDHDAVYVNAPPGAEADRTRVKPGDVLLTITGSRIGRVSAVHAEVGEAYISQHVAIIRLKDQLRPRFASIFLSLPSGGQAQIAKVQYGQTKPGLNLDQIRNFRIPYPPIEMQDRFLETWDKLEVTTDHQQQALSASDDLFNSLVQRAFSGELLTDHTKAAHPSL